MLNSDLEKKSMLTFNFCSVRQTYIPELFISLFFRTYQNVETLIPSYDVSYMSFKFVEGDLYSINCDI